MAWNGLAEVFDFEGTFKARGEEAAEGRNEGGECCEDENVELHWGDVNGGTDLEGGREREVGEEVGYMVGLMDENRVRGAGEACKYIRAEVLTHN